MKLLVLSDIHGNLTALDAVLDDAYSLGAPDAVALLGDAIDYGMRSNEVIERIEALDLPVVCSLWGNHEKAICEENYERFSSQRGVASAQHTRSILSEHAFEWLQQIPGKEGHAAFEFASKRMCAFHGSIEDPFWKAIDPATVDPEHYARWDIVFSGHNHVPHCFTKFIKVDDPAHRDKRAIVFVNPGSVGQPRNHSNKAHYAYWDSDDGVFLRSVAYDYAFEQSLFDNSVDAFYRDRLETGV